MNHEYLYKNCQLCPRRCGVDRTAGEVGFCGQSNSIRVASAVLHRGEEPFLIGEHGSGVVFFSGCTLGCVFCQNKQISSGCMGRDISPDELARIFLKLQASGAANLNLVTGTPHLPGIARALELAVEQGLTLRVIWNTSGYETPETLALLRPLVDIYLPDLKTLNSALASRFFKAADYPEVSSVALDLMAAHKTLEWSGDELVKGTVVRHLMLPGFFESTEEVLSFYSKNLKSRTIPSLMVQFYPPDPECPLQGRTSGSEYDRLIELLDDLEIGEGLLQELDDGNCGGEWVPDFSRFNPFPGDFADPVWHWLFKF